MRCFDQPLSATLTVYERVEGRVDPIGGSARLTPRVTYECQLVGLYWTLGRRARRTACAADSSSGRQCGDGGVTRALPAIASDTSSDRGTRSAGVSLDPERDRALIECYVAAAQRLLN